MSVEIVPMSQSVMTSSTNPIVVTVAQIRATQDDLTQRQRSVREMGRRRVAAMLDTEAFTMGPRR